MPKAPPRFVQNVGAWEYVLAKLEMKGKLTDNGDPQNYAAACAIYKNVVKKYAGFQIPNVDVQPIRTTIEASQERTWALNDLADDYPIGTMFWMDDVLCEAAERNGGMAVYPDPDGYLLIWAKVLDVDPEGQYRDWPAGKMFGAQPHRCADLVEAAV